MLPEEDKVYSVDEIWMLRCSECKAPLKLEFPSCKEGLVSVSCCNKVYGLYPKTYTISWDALN